MAECHLALRLWPIVRYPCQCNIYSPDLIDNKTRFFSLDFKRIHTQHTQIFGLYWSLSQFVLICCHTIDCWTWDFSHLFYWLKICDCAIVMEFHYCELSLLHGIYNNNCHITIDNCEIYLNIYDRFLDGIVSCKAAIELNQIEIQYGTKQKEIYG